MTTTLFWIGLILVVIVCSKLKLVKSPDYRDKVEEDDWLV
ncbi:hypothetical protein Phi4:1_gp110 [Cellulophaga phage phi4:1]|uniref:Uncharacterized protein n=3 Tax=Lightbulbvirus Cba41 TaxID=1918524 RepID=A0A0S2MWR8_9CAUD|nr:hypothetical protein Phi4:1_gp110 [Cellulophaga phage phi4:1]AGO49523.1 hypothetical protein Phi4:1_gp110 [Cellulophaga phage phi4:1]ALO80119.1 hypothetical protein Phi4113_110 [Cellulophaga phage phi4:1_13]ALO80316.1 hypothetical protein Phi4118_110 [Cellulophaga phage phi4:1_18]